jgi:hypothetical protein
MDVYFTNSSLYLSQRCQRFSPPYVTLIQCDANVFIYTSIYDVLHRTASPTDNIGSFTATMPESEVAPISPIEDVSLSPLRS